VAPYLMRQVVMAERERGALAEHSR
jgi:hypothetical protein